MFYIHMTQLKCCRSPQEPRAFWHTAIYDFLFCSARGTTSESQLAHTIISEKFLGEKQMKSINISNIRKAQKGGSKNKINAC